jgi:hypothetical protein
MTYYACADVAYVGGSMGQAGRSLVVRNKGALDLTLSAVKKLL